MLRREDRVPAKLLARWPQLRSSDHLLLRTRKIWFEGAVSQALKHRGSDTVTAIAAAESLELTKFIPMLVDLAETEETEEIRQGATSATLKLAHILGGRASIHVASNLRYTQNFATGRCLSAVVGMGRQRTTADQQRYKHASFISGAAC